MAFCNEEYTTPEGTRYRCTRNEHPNEKIFHEWRRVEKFLLPDAAPAEPAAHEPHESQAIDDFDWNF